MPSVRRRCKGHYALMPEDLADHVAHLTTKIKASGLAFDAIAFCGASGALVAGPLALALGAPLILVRKPADKVRWGYRVEGPTDNVNHYILIDDLIDTGATVRHVLAAVGAEYPQATCLGIFLYAWQNPDREDRRDTLPADIPLFDGPGAGQ